MATRGDSAGQVTRLLSACSDGERGAFDQLIPLVYEDLRRIAHHHLRSERPDHTLSTTAVVHEAYLQLADQTRASWRDRAHFLAIAGRVMRRILIDYARRHGAEKRGGARIRIPLRPDTAAISPESVDLLDLDAALTELAGHNDRMARVVECRFFGALTADETAEVLGTSLRSVERDWTRAKAYLYRLLAPGEPGPDH